MSDLINSRISISCQCSGIFSFIMNNHITLWFHGKLINLCLRVLIRMVFRPMSSKHSWGHDLLIDPQVDMKSYQLTFLCEQNFWQNFIHCNFEGNYFLAHKKYCYFSVFFVKNYRISYWDIIFSNTPCWQQFEDMVGLWPNWATFIKINVSPESHIETLQTVRLVHWHKVTLYLGKQFSWGENYKKISMSRLFNKPMREKFCVDRTSLQRDSIQKTSIYSKWVKVIFNASFLVSLNKSGIESYRNKYINHKQDRNMQTCLANLTAYFEGYGWSNCRVRLKLMQNKWIAWWRHLAKEGDTQKNSMGIITEIQKSCGFSLAFQWLYKLWRL